MFFVVKYCIKHVGLVKNAVFLINNCLEALSSWMLSGIHLLSGNNLFPYRYPVDYYPLSGKMVSGTSLKSRQKNEIPGKNISNEVVKFQRLVEKYCNVWTI